MPLYEYRCSCCSGFELSFRMGQAPVVMDCPRCGVASPRRLSVPRLVSTNTPARRLLESTHRSAEQPDVVQTIPPAGSRPAPRGITNPLRRNLPRP
jgi:putative FmdB family regulatory protein